MFLVYNYIMIIIINPMEVRDYEKSEYGSVNCGV